MSTSLNDPPFHEVLFLPCGSEHLHSLEGALARQTKQGQLTDREIVRSVRAQRIHFISVQFTPVRYACVIASVKQASTSVLLPIFLGFQHCAELKVPFFSGTCIQGSSVHSAQGISDLKIQQSSRVPSKAFAEFSTQRCPFLFSIFIFA